jgi:hypothetical protein
MHLIYHEQHFHVVLDEGEKPWSLTWKDKVHV